MNEKNRIEKLLYRVILNNGHTIEHVYDMPSTMKKLREHIDEEIDRILSAIKPGGIGILYFSNPSIIYNPSNVAAVEMSNVTTSQLEEATKRASKKAGFVKRG